MVTPVKYESDSKIPTDIFSKKKKLFMENLSNEALVTTDDAYIC